MPSWVWKRNPTAELSGLDLVICSVGFERRIGKWTNSFSLTLVYWVCRCCLFPLYKLLAEPSLGWNIVLKQAFFTLSLTLHLRLSYPGAIPEPVLSSFPKHQGSVSWASGKGFLESQFFVWLTVRLHPQLKSCHRDSVRDWCFCVSCPCLGRECLALPEGWKYRVVLLV